MKKVIALILALALVLSLCACGAKSTETTETTETEETQYVMKAGLITLHDTYSPYDNNFIEAFYAACEKANIEPVVKVNIEESEICYETACDLAEEGCSFIFADSFSHEDFLIRAAKEYEDVQFCHATGYQAAGLDLDNFHDSFASIYEGRYLAGVAAGLKLNEMIEDGTITADQAKVGYVGAKPYAEIISGYTAWFLGVRSVVESATMEVIYTNEWYDETAEKEAAITLMENGCVLISQHADSMGAPTACEAAGVPNVAYNGSTEEACPNTYITSSKIDWEPYFTYCFNLILEGKGAEIENDYIGDFSTGSVVVLPLGAVAPAAGTQEILDTVKAELMAGTRHVFDCSTFTVGGETLTTYDVYGQDAVVDGYFAESTLQSAPYFALQIDGITILGE